MANNKTQIWAYWNDPPEKHHESMTNAMMPLPDQRNMFISWFYTSYIKTAHKLLKVFLIKKSLGGLAPFFLGIDWMRVFPKPSSIRGTWHLSYSLPAEWTRWAPGTRNNRKVDTEAEIRTRIFWPPARRSLTTTPTRHQSHQLTREFASTEPSAGLMVASQSFTQATNANSRNNGVTIASHYLYIAFCIRIGLKS